jgi:serine/threonine protein phosphatase 1
MRIYAVGDIHGQLDMLRAAHARIEADRARVKDHDALVVHLGDLVDRGPDSRGVVDLLRAGTEGGAPWIVLHGNHDRMFVNFLRTGSVQDSGLRRELTWFDPRLGGEDTLASYGVRLRRWTTPRGAQEAAIAAVPPEHIAFLASRPLMHQADELLFVHAGIRPGVPLDQQVENDLVWIRSPFLEDDRDHGPLIVHGHTVVDEPSHFGNRIALDTGAGYDLPLTAAVFEGRDCFVLTEDGRVPLPPPPGWAR